MHMTETQRLTSVASMKSCCMQVSRPALKVRQDARLASASCMMNSQQVYEQANEINLKGWMQSLLEGSKKRVSDATVPE